MAAAPDARILSDAEHALAQHIRTERVRFVYLQSPLAILFAPLSAAVLSVTLWNTISHTVLVVFVSVSAAIALFRTVLRSRFPDPPPQGDALDRWEWAFIVSITIVDLWWGVGALMLIEPGITAGNAIVFCFVMMMAGGQVSSYSAHPLIVVLGMLALTAPITVVFALRWDTFHLALAFVSVMFNAAAFRSINTLGYFFSRTYRLAYELEQARDRAEHVARCDMLTGINNRRAFYELGEAARAQHAATGEPLSLLVIDIDHFKSINDRFGHAAGDVAICAAARMLEDASRGDDIPGRLGGEEFGLLLRDASTEEGRAIGQALVERAAAKRTRYEDIEIPFTMSAGLATMKPGETLDAFVARTDAALYEAKRGGRNRVVVAA